MICTTKLITYLNQPSSKIYITEMLSLTNMLDMISLANKIQLSLIYIYFHTPILKIPLFLTLYQLYNCQASYKRIYKSPTMYNQLLTYFFHFLFYLHKKFLDKILHGTKGQVQNFGTIMFLISSKTILMLVSISNLQILK